MALQKSLLRGKRNVHQFVGDILSTNDYATVQKVLEESETYLKPIDVNLLPEKQEKLLNEIKRQTTYFQESPPNLGGEVHSAIPGMLRFCYNRQNETRTPHRYFVAAIIVLGYTLLGLPALDLFV